MSASLPNNWALAALSKCGRWYSGGTPNTTVDEYWNGDIPWITASSLKNFYITDSERRVTRLGVQNGTRLVPANTILFVVRGMSLNTEFRIGIACRDMAFGQDCKAIIVGNEINPLFLAYALKSKESEILQLVDQASHGTGRLQTSLLENVQIPIPPLAEQRKIAAILGTWDAAIDKAERLVAALRARKRALMQRLLTGEVRFPKFGEPSTNSTLPSGWQRVRLDQAFKRVQRTVSTEPKHALSITAKVGFVDQQEKFGRVIAGKSLERYVQLRKGEFAYNKGNSGSYPQGCIYRLEEFEEGAVPNVYYCFSPKNEKIYSDFYKYYFESGALNRQLSRLINSGVRNDGLLNLSSEEFFRIEILMPPHAEQVAIANVLGCADQEIAAARKQLDRLQAQKRGLMQRLLTGEVRVASGEER